MIFYSIQGIQRLILNNCISATDLDKFERIALDLVKKGNEQTANASLKLLLTCIYIGKFILTIEHTKSWVN